MQFDSNPANGFGDMVRKRNTDAQTHIRTARHGDDNTPPLLRGRGIKKIKHNFIGQY